MSENDTNDKNRTNEFLHYFTQLPPYKGEAVSWLLKHVNEIELLLSNDTTPETLRMLADKWFAEGEFEAAIITEYKLVLLTKK